MATAASTNADQPVGTRLQRLFGEANIGNVVKGAQAAVVDPLNMLGGIAEGADDDVDARTRAGIEEALRLIGPPAA